MNRLRKIALIGDLNINDVNFIEEPEMIRIEITNIEKIKHTPGSWGEYYRSYYREDLPNVVGFIKYNDPRNMSDKEGVELFVNYLEIMPQYRGTLLAKWLLEKFQSTVLEPLISQYGKENIYLDANFANEALSKMLRRVTKKMGIKWSKNEGGQNAPEGFEGATSNNVPDQSRDIARAIERIGADYNYSELDGFVIHNFDIVAIGNAICNRGLIANELYGEILNGDVTIKTSEQGASSSDKTFEYSHQNKFVEFYGDVIRDSYTGYNDPENHDEDEESEDSPYLEANMKEVFSGVITLQYQGKAYELEDLIGILTGDGEYALTATKINRLKKLAKK